MKCKYSDIKDRDIINAYYAMKNNWENYNNVATDMAVMLNDKDCMGHDRKSITENKIRYQALSDGLMLGMVIIENMLKKRGTWDDKILTGEF